MSDLRELMHVEDQIDWVAREHELCNEALIEDQFARIRAMRTEIVDNPTKNNIINYYKVWKLKAKTCKKFNIQRETLERILKEEVVL